MGSACRSIVSCDQLLQSVRESEAPGAIVRMPDMTTQPPQKDPIITRFRTVLGEIYGPRIERVLFGSRARGDACPDSDYDVSVFLRDMPDRMVEMNQLADLSTAILDETGEFIHAMPYRAGSYNEERVSLMHEIRAYGIDL
jgi:predicted nucleotidyltransferase